ncbi:MAG: hypothetical protein EZS28_008134 [Streblomastix strix]|uniref:Uncharacterized protein n=1 Tax=Streblomastix strix TaxID=222440 RepID=A0A5J4WMN4_9EUKA|nr:MAG: hypothetical protein EZS28_008134 [Streblomastix strix]
MKTKEINISEPKQNFVHLNLQARGNQIHDSSSFSVKVDIVAKDVFFRCSEAGFIGGDLYGRIFDHQMEKYRNEIPKEGRDQIPVFYIDPRFLVRGVHRNTNIQQEKIALIYPKDSFTIKVREDDTSFDVILSILLARGMLMTLQEALKLNIWIEDVTNSVLPIWDVKQEPGTIFKQGIMILIGRHSPLDKTQNIVNCISVCGGSEIHDRNIILKELSNLSHIIYLFRGDYENMIPQQQKLKIFSEQIEEEGGIEEVEAQLSNKGFNGDISSAALKTKIVALLNLLKR